jgi:hypothetical protein
MLNKEEIKKANDNYKKRYPWRNHYDKARYRCENKKYACYDFYGGRGIKFLMTVDDFRDLWFENKAWLLKRPSIDRIDNNGDYVKSNCRFIEQSENLKRGNFFKNSEHARFKKGKIVPLSWRIAISKKLKERHKLAARSIKQ